MPVVINEFEVVNEQAGAQNATAQGPVEVPAQNPALTAQDVEKIVRRQQERLLRVMAC